MEGGIRKVCMALYGAPAGGAPLKTRARTLPV